MAATETDGFTIPETVTVPGDVAVETCALIEAFANVVADMHKHGSGDWIYNSVFHDSTAAPLWEALVADQPSDAAGEGCTEEIFERAELLEAAIRVDLINNGGLALTRQIMQLERQVRELGARVIGVEWVEQGGYWASPKRESSAAS